MFDSLESPLDALIRPDRENPPQQQQSSQQQQQQQAVHHIWIDGIQVWKLNLCDKFSEMHWSDPRYENLSKSKEISITRFKDCTL